MTIASGFYVSGKKIDIFATSAKNSEKLGGQAPSYYATKTLVDGKQDKLTTEQLSAISSVSGHINDTVKHITSAERNTWNSKQAALSTTQLSAISSVSGHINNSNIHVTSTDKSNWNNKATSADITNAINALDISDSAVANQFVTKVSETDGKISVSRAQPTIANVSGLQTALNGKQATISDLSTIRTSAANGQTAYNWGNHSTAGYLKSADINGKEDKANKVSAWSTTPSDTKYPSEKLVKTALDNKVDKVSGKGLSTNDYTTTEMNKLAGIAAGAEVNQNAFSNISIGSTTIAADTKTDTLTMVAGTNIALTPDATNDKITISAKDTTYDIASMRAAGLLSVDDKTKLDNIEEEAQKNVKSDWAVTASDNDAYIKNKPIIPVVYDGRLTINRNNRQVAIFNANQSTDVTANISVPIALSELQNDADYTTVDDVDSAIREHNVNYTSHLDIRNDIIGKEDKTNKVTAWSSTASDINYPSEKLVKTALDGKQNTLTTQSAYSAKGTATKVPQITTNNLGQVTNITEVTITQPTVNNGTLTVQKNGTTVTSFKANQSTNVTANITVPTTLSNLTDDATHRLVTDTQISNWNNKSNTDEKVVVYDVPAPNYGGNITFHNSADGTSPDYLFNSNLVYNFDEKLLTFSNGTIVAGTFNGTATDASKLNGQLASYYAATTGSYTASNGMKVYSAVSANNANNLGGRAASKYVNYDTITVINNTALDTLTTLSGNNSFRLSKSALTVPAGRVLDVTYSITYNISPGQYGGPETYYYLSTTNATSAAGAVTNIKSQSHAIHRSTSSAVAAMEYPRFVYQNTTTSNQKLYIYARVATANMQISNATCRITDVKGLVL